MIPSDGISDDISRALQDLQAQASLRNFHKTHFPGQRIPQLRERSSPLPDLAAPACPKHDNSDGSDENEYDKRGWYDDGAKRTLTDETIEMFRHSEIQRILQQRRLHAELADSHLDRQAQSKAGQGRQSKRARTNMYQAEHKDVQMVDVRLDGTRGGQEGQAGQKRASPTGQVESQTHPRKVVQYEDELDKLDKLDQRQAEKAVVEPSGSTSASSSFHWPQLDA